MTETTRMFYGRYKPVKLPAYIAAAIGSNMFEGFVPTKKNIKIAKDYMDGDISIKDLIEIAKKKLYV